MLNDLGNRYQYLVIDTNNLFLRNFYVMGKKIDVEALKDLSIDEYKDIKYSLYRDTLASCISMINKFLNSFGYQNSEVFFLQDNPMSAYELREMLSNGQYKHNRRMGGKEKDEIYHLIDQFVGILKNYSSNFRFLKYDGVEADDLVPNVINAITISDNKKMLLISADLDWSRGIEQNIDWYNYTTMFNIKRYKEKYGFEPVTNKVQIYKSFRGDKSDCIPIGVTGIRKELLLYIIETYSDLDSLFKNLWTDDNIPKKWKERIKLNQPQLKSNYSLVDYFDVNEDFDNICVYGKENLKVLKVKYNVFKLPLEDRMIERPKNHGFMQPTSFRIRKR